MLHFFWSEVQCKCDSPEVSAFWISCCLFVDNVYEYPAIAKQASLTPPGGGNWKFEERFPPPPIFPPPPPSWRGDANALLREAIWAGMVDQIKRAIKVPEHAHSLSVNYSTATKHDTKSMQCVDCVHIFWPKSQFSTNLNTRAWHLIAFPTLLYFAQEIRENEIDKKTPIFNTGKGPRNPTG